MYVKILKANMKHNDFQYSEGLNIDTKKFNPTGTCQPGGLYFCKLQDMPRYLEYGVLIADVEIPTDAKVYEEEHKLKADQLILKNIIPLNDHECWLDAEFCKLAATIDSNALKYIKNRSKLPFTISILQKLMKQLSEYKKKFYYASTPANFNFIELKNLTISATFAYPTDYKTEEEYYKFERYRPIFYGGHFEKLYYTIKIKDTDEDINDEANCTVLIDINFCHSNYVDYSCKRKEIDYRNFNVSELMTEIYKSYSDIKNLH